MFGADNVIAQSQFVLLRLLPQIPTETEQNALLGCISHKVERWVLKQNIKPMSSWLRVNPEAIVKPVISIQHVLNWEVLIVLIPAEPNFLLKKELHFLVNESGHFSAN